MFLSGLPALIVYSFYTLSSLQDDNRYCAGRGVHKNLKRAEKARTLVNKITCELLQFNFVNVSPFIPFKAKLGGILNYF